MLTQLVTDRRAWRANSLDERRSWYHTLSKRCLAALDETVRALRDRPRPTTELRAALEPCAICADDLQPVREALDRGRGFAVVRGSQPEAYSAAELRVAYWLIGQLLGQPVAQDAQGTLLYDVRDTGQEVRYGARFSVTNAESSFHTDNSFGTGLVDYVGLLCLQGAKHGGLSQILSGYSVHNELLEHQPDVLEVLYQPFHIERRGGLQPGEAPTAQHPIVFWDPGGLTFRYLRYWIESGHKRIGQPLSAAQQQALDALDGVLNDPGLRAEFVLDPGDLFFINNRWILHNRTAFEDYSEPDRRRHLVRLWLKGPA
jgi:alpha-ketoglutarate-dependent taurine dioxygenase